MECIEAEYVVNWAPFRELSGDLTLCCLFEKPGIKRKDDLVNIEQFFVDVKKVFIGFLIGLSNAFL